MEKNVRRADSIGHTSKQLSIYPGKPSGARGPPGSSLLPTEKGSCLCDCLAEGHANPLFYTLNPERPKSPLTQFPTTGRNSFMVPWPP